MRQFHSAACLLATQVDRVLADGLKQKVEPRRCEPRSGRSFRLARRGDLRDIDSLVGLAARDIIGEIYDSAYASTTEPTRCAVAQAAPEPRLA